VTRPSRASTDQAATEGLIRVGAAALGVVRAAADDPEARRRAERVLARAATPAAREALATLAAGGAGAEYMTDAKAPSPARPGDRPPRSDGPVSQ
jgi:hypothetical protein